MKVFFLHKIILLLLFKISIASQETEENKYFQIKTESDKYNLYSLANNQNKYKFLNIQIIFSKIISSKSYISLFDDKNTIIYETDVTSTRNFIIKIEEYVESNLKFNATSPEMYVQYQYIEQNKDIILPSGKILDFDLNSNSISLKIIPVLNNTETKYDLYYLGNSDYEDIYEKFIFSLNNNPIGSITKNITNNSDLNFENIQNNIGYYFIKGNNINELSYTYFYESIFVANKEKYYNTTDNEFFNINTTSNEHYSFYNINNTKKNNFLNFQIFLSKKERNSHFILLNEDSDEIFDTNIISDRQFIVDVKNENKKMKIMASSPEMYVKYQFIEEDRDIILPSGKIYDFDLNSNSISLKITPLLNNTETKYDLYYLGNYNSNNTYDKLIFSLNNIPISTVTKNITNNSDLNFENIQNNIGYYFIKGNNINELSYTYFYESIFVANKEKYYNTTDNEFFNINTTSNEHYSFYNINNVNKNNYLNFQIFLSKKERNSHFILLNEDNYEIWDTDIISHRQFIVNVKNENKKMKIMASSPEMYVKYQFIEEDRDIILPLGKIYDLDFTTNSISFGLIPPIKNTETKYDLYYIGNNNYNNTYDKFIFSLNNIPISTVTKKISDKMILNFENIQNNIGYYFIKGNNINELSYTYFYESILLNNIFNTTEKVFFNITTTSDEIYSFYNINDTNKKNFVNIQLFTKQKNDYSHFILLNENNQDICNYIINNEKQFQVNIQSQTKLKIKSNSTQMLIQYQYIEKDPQISEIQGKLISVNSNNNGNSIYFEIIPIIYYSNTTYELYFSKENILNETFNKLEYSLNHEPISTITIFGNEKVTLNFTYNLTSDENKTENGYAFVKANNINETNYIYFYGVVNASIHYNSNKKTNPGTGTNLLPIIIIVIIILVIIVLFVLRSKQIICKREISIDVSGELIDDKK